MFPRSCLRKQPTEWVQLSDSMVIANVIGLCRVHHDNVTGEIGGHRARLALENDLLYWYERADDGWKLTGPLDPQPQGIYGEPPPKQDPAVCPTCGHVKPREGPPRAPRKAKTWTVDVPDDAEDGAEVLDVLVDDIASLLGYGNERSRLRRFHALVAVFAWTQQRREQFTHDILEASRG